MKKFWIISNLIVLGFLISVCLLGIFYKHISFGWGLGDLFGYTLLFGITLTHLLITLNFAFRNKSESAYKSLSITFLVLSLYISLKATIWRGKEYDWNGSIFYTPCPIEIKVQNEKVDKAILITMCSLEYYSEFMGKWDGQFLVLDTGEIKIPEELKKHISQPIEKVLLESDYFNKYVNEKTVKEFDLLTDTLKINKIYYLSGEISGVKNMTPIMKVKINKKQLTRAKKE